MQLFNIKTENIVTCQDVVNTEAFFDTSVAPPLLFYSYIPILFLLIFFTGFVLIKDRFSLRSKLLLGVGLSFSLWITNILFQWTAVWGSVVHFSWEITPIFEIPVYFFSFYFVYYFIYQRPLPRFMLMGIVFLCLPILFLLPTPINMSAFDIVDCVAIQGRLWDYIFVFEILFIFFTAYVGFKGYSHVEKRGESKAFLFLLFGTVLFLLTFFLSEFIGELTGVYEFNLIGPVGAMIFILLLTYSTIRFNLFNLKLLGVHSLIIALWFLVFSLLFVHTISLVQTMVGITLILLTIVGTLLIRGFSREVKQREEITLLAQDLQKANARLKELDKQKSEFVSLASHQLRGPITAVNGYVSLILAGDYGDVTPNIKEALEKVQTASKDLGLLVGDYLDITRIELGRMKYEFADVSLTKIAQDVCDQMSQVALHNGLTLANEISTEAMLVHADANKLKQVMLNLVDNAVKYTPQGSITVAVRAVAGKAQFSVKDTGTGMSTKVLDSIFEKFVRAPGAQRVNATGTGLGLFVARKIITEHKGRIWAESAGEGKGSTFSFEIDLLK